MSMFIFTLMAIVERHHVPQTGPFGLQSAGKTISTQASALLDRSIARAFLELPIAPCPMGLAARASARVARGSAVQSFVSVPEPGKRRLLLGILAAPVGLQPLRCKP